MYRQVLARRTSRILILDDDRDSADLLECVLRDYCAVSKATTFSEAAALVAERRFDLYVVDERLTDGSGLEFCRHLRSLDRNTPVIFCSALIPRLVEGQALDAGADAFFLKPIDYPEVLGRARELLTAAIKRSTEAANVVRDTVAAEHGRRSRTVDSACSERSRSKAATDRPAPASEREMELRTRAFHSFVEAGGTPAHFEEIWGILRMSG